MAGLKVTWRDGVAYATGTIAGRRFRQSLGTRDRSQAQELCAQYEAKLWKRHTYGEEAVRTFEEAALSYLQQGGEGRFLPPILKHFKGRSIGSIKPGEVRAMALTIYPNGAAVTRNRQAIVPARAVINHGHDLGWCGAIKVQQFETVKSRKHMPVDRAWLDAFMARADADKLPHLSAIVLFMHHTAARISEAVRLVGEHVDLGKRVAVLARTKTDEWSPRRLTAELVARIAGLGLKDGERVFGYTDPKAVNRRMKAVCIRAGIPVRTTHSAGRHSFGTIVYNSTGNVKTAMDGGGWKSARLFMETYVHSGDAGAAAAAVFDAETGPIDTGATQALPRRKSTFGNRYGKH